MTVFGHVQQDDRTPEEVTALRERVTRELIAALGERWVSTDPLILDTYTWQYVAEIATGTNYMERPLAVVLPANTEEVSEVVKICNRLGCQYKAMSTGFGAWNAPSRADFVVQIDLRRMDRIVEIDEKNMIAVIEPYVTGNQLQTEAMKRRLNTHIVGAGAQASVLAGATSMMGQGWDGVSMGFSDRNLLAAEWVLPDGRIIHAGSPEICGKYFSGDGPGFSLRGVMRGFGGALGGLGVFTRCAVKLYPYHGPAELARQGQSPEYYVEIPENTAAGVIVVDDWKALADLGYQLGEAEICDYLGRNAPSLISGILTADNNEFAGIYKIPLLHEMYYALVYVIIGADSADFSYRMKTLKKIVKGLNGGILYNGLSLSKFYWMGRMVNTLRRRIGLRPFLKSMPGFLKLLWRDVRKWGLKGLDTLSMLCYDALLRSGLNMRGVFRFGGSFWTSMGALVSWDNAIRGAKVGAQVKQKYIDKKVIMDDGADNAWGGLYEGGAYSHLEELCCYDPRDAECRENVLDFIFETNLACIETRCGDSLNAIGPPNHALYSPECMNYDAWQQKIKKSLDEKNAADATFYTDPEFAKNPPERAVQTLERVLKNRATIVIED
ncbi:MAG: FAD-binding oxidoreductase [Thermodesulfobacteriota bacterium]